MRARTLLPTLFSLLVLAGTAQADPVNYKELLPLLSVSLPGWTAGTPTGQTMKSPMEFSEATLSFTKGDMSLEVAIYDGGPAMAAAMAATSQVEMESPEQVVKPVNIKGFKGSLFIHPQDKDADLVLMVPSRFAVSLHLDGGTDGELLKAAVSQMNLEKLASMGK